MIPRESCLSRRPTTPEATEDGRPCEDGRKCNAAPRRTRDLKLPLPPIQTSKFPPAGGLSALVQDSPNLVGSFIGFPKLRSELRRAKFLPEWACSMDSGTAFIRIHARIALRRCSDQEMVLGLFGGPEAVSGRNRQRSEASLLRPEATACHGRQPFSLKRPKVALHSSFRVFRVFPSEATLPCPTRLTWRSCNSISRLCRP